MAFYEKCNYISATKNNSLGSNRPKTVQKTPCKALRESVVNDFPRNLLGLPEENNRVTYVARRFPPTFAINFRRWAKSEYVNKHTDIDTEMLKI